MQYFDSREAMYQEVVAQALRDEGFRSALVKEPRKVLESYFGIPLPGNVTITVIEETAENLYIVLPSAQAEIEESELAAEELEAVAGGNQNQELEAAGWCTITDGCGNTCQGSCGCTGNTAITSQVA